MKGSARRMETDTDRHFIEHMHWDEVARRIGDGAVAILPIGAAAKQHGFHLPLNTDRIQAEWLAGRMAEKIDALIWPTLTYGHYPAFVEYAGSSSLSISTFEALVREVAGQILGSGCPKLLVLNTGISTLAPVDRALARLASERVKHLWIHEGPRYPRVARQLAEQSHGSHADELETSLMLALAPHRVDMTRAGAFRWTVAAAVLVAMLASALSFRADAQSEYMRGNRMPYDAFDRLPTTDLDVPGGTIHVAFAPGDIALPPEKLLGWIRMSARAVASYYGRFPVASLRLLLVPVDGGRIRGGTTWGYRGAAIRIPLGRDSTEEVLRRDWVMVHEMVHTALPDMPDRYAWLSEGLAVYVEPVARVQAGDLMAREIWQAMMRDMPKGLPQAGDQGLDNTPTWGRKYWGGAMFCLLADIEIRKRTNNRLGLQDAMRGVLAAGGNHEQDWPIERILATADKAVGVDVLTRLHNEMGPKPVTPDLAALWRDLGLKRIGEDIEFDDTAPLAAIRKAITQAPAK